jgi:hypothetical protein
MARNVHRRKDPPFFLYAFCPLALDDDDLTSRPIRFSLPATLLAARGFAGAIYDDTYDNIDD